jgi:hypothetical protein
VAAAYSFVLELNMGFPSLKPPDKTGQAYPPTPTATSDKSLIILVLQKDLCNSFGRKTDIGKWVGTVNPCNG